MLWVGGGVEGGIGGDGEDLKKILRTKNFRGRRRVSFGDRHREGS